ncbi:MAG: hypothetical protein WA734_06560, partial [Candidatus Acidiferrales bacterium]
MDIKEYIERANGIFIVKRFEHDCVTVIKLADLLRDGTDARGIEFTNCASVMKHAEACGNPLSFSAGALLEVTT